MALPRVVIVGGGFGGLAAAKALRNAPVQITVLDRRNHHVFQPLLYQVATAALSPADIASPIRRALRGVRNGEVRLADVKSIDLARRVVRLESGELEYDWLILAAGATHSYFGHDDWASIAPGLKTLEDATEMRRRMLMAFEQAEYEEDEAARRAILTFAIVGGGPTGVELAGAIREIALKTMPRDFRRVDTRTTRVMLLEGDPRLLAAFPAPLAERARLDLVEMGVEVRLSSRVVGVEPAGVHVQSGVSKEFVEARTIFWAAGVRGSPIAQSLGVPLDRSGRVIVEADLSLPGHPEVFVVGDLACARSASTGEVVPGVAQGAMQGGRHAARIIRRECASPAARGSPREARRASSAPGPREPFRYRDKGSMATIGRARAVALIGRRSVTGFPAWLIWSALHVTFLITFRSRLAVLLNWAWNWFFFSRDARLITGETRRDCSDSPLHHESAR